MNATLDVDRYLDGYLDAMLYGRVKPAAGQQTLWKEEDHPRDADGKFAETGAASQKKSDSNILTLLQSETLSPEDIAERLGVDLSDIRGEIDELIESGAVKSHKKRHGELLWADEDVSEPDESADEGSDDTSSPGEAQEPDADTDEPDPREAAEDATDQQQTDYEFARESEIPNVGEDLKGSARHKVNAWRSLEEAEADGTAAEFVTRAQLLKNEPPNFVVLADDNPLTALAMHLALSKFPPKPGYGGKRRRAGESEEENRKDRQRYLESYRKLKGVAEDLARIEENPETAVTKFRDAVRSQIAELRSGHFTNQYDNTANALIATSKAMQWGRWSKKTSVWHQMEGFAKLVDEHYSTLEPHGRMEKITEHAKDVIEGKSVAKSFGVESGSSAGGKPKFNPADAYVAHAERKGGPDISKLTKSANDATKYMVESMGMRGVQWGNSVTDDERQHHARKSAEAFADLTDILGLDAADASLDGTLGLAIGARGHGTAMAHYEPGSKVINLTRKNGVGSLAHEWGHFFDHHVAGGKVSSSGGDYYSQHVSPTRFKKDENGRLVAENGKLVSQDLSADPLWKAYDKLRTAWRESGFKKRLGAVVSEMVRSGLISKSKRNYWTSHEEVFARTFERYVQRKLEAADRSNTYLTGLSGASSGEDGLWPTDTEVDAMTPAFDKIIEVYRGQPRKAAKEKNERAGLVARYERRSGLAAMLASEFQSRGF